MVFSGLNNGVLRLALGGSQIKNIKHKMDKNQSQTHKQSFVWTQSMITLI